MLRGRAGHRAVRRRGRRELPQQRRPRRHDAPAGRRAEHRARDRRHAAAGRSSTTTAIYAWQFHVDWDDPSRTRLDGPVKIAVAPYRLPVRRTAHELRAAAGRRRAASTRRATSSWRASSTDASDARESVVAVHSVNTAAGGGGVRWYEFRVGDGSRRSRCISRARTRPMRSTAGWRARAIDRAGNIGIGYSFGGTPHFAGQRFAGRAGRRPARRAHAARDGAGRGRGGADEHAALGGLHADRDRPGRRLHDLVRRRLPTQRGGDLFDSRIGAFRLPGCK